MTFWIVRAEKDGRNEKSALEKNLITIGWSKIPDLSKIDLKSNKAKVIIFKQKLFYYKFNLAYPKIDWFGSKSCKIKDLKDISWLRNIKNRKYNLTQINVMIQ